MSKVGRVHKPTCIPQVCARAVHFYIYNVGGGAHGWVG